MKILLSAYACEPNRGSEPGIGWKWALTLANNRENEVHVITRANNKDVIEEYWKSNEKPASLIFHYFDCSKFLIWAKKHHLPVNIYYACWLYGSGTLAKKLNEKYHFDIAHHITFGVYRDAPCLFKLGIPTVIGPVGGGEYTPKNLLPLFSTKEKAKEWIRIIANRLSILNPIIHKSFNQASIILSKTDDTKNDLFKKSWVDKTTTVLELGIDSMPKQLSIERNYKQFIFVGRFTYWKGIKLALMAFNNYCKEYDDKAKLIFIGKGEMTQYINSFAVENNLKDNIEIIDWIEQKELVKYYQSSCAMIFPSLHDSSGNVVLESLAYGLPVVCLECGGPASVMGGLKETMINPYNKTIEQVVDDIAKMMNKLATNNLFYNQVKQKSLARASEFIWKEHVENVYTFIERKMLSK